MSDWVLLETKVNSLYFAPALKKMFLFFRIHQPCIIKLRVISRILLFFFFPFLKETSPKLIIPDFTFIISYVLLNWLIAKMTHAILMQAR